MAFRPGKRKDVKKQSYYVWFLGAKESKGLRGEEYIRPVLRYLQDREKELEPMKVTLQVSNKGTKIIQNVPRKNNKGKTEQIKHFIPHHAITCVLQESKPDDDIVSCILLIYNPITKCPVHVHAYRCDSVETATTLRTQLQILIERPENQKKFREIENRLAAKGLLPSRRLNSDGRSTRTDDSDRTEDSFGSERDMPVSPRKENIASLYDSLAAELRERLTNKNNCPILLPPKDYDTISRSKGKLDGIDKRRSTHLSIVGLNPTPKIVPAKNEKGRESGSSGKSSGIGSDEALSSAIQEVTSHPDFESKEIDPDTSSDEEDWPASEALPIDDEVVPTEWRKAPPTGGPNRYRPPSPTQHHPQAPPPIHPPSSERYHRDERDSYNASHHQYDRRSPPVQEFRQFSLQRSKTMERDEEPHSFDYRHGPPDHRAHSRAYRDEAKSPVEKPRTPEREPEVVYRRRSNPLERKSSRESRPVSYPGNFASHQTEPEPPVGPPTFQYGYPVPERAYEARGEPRGEIRGEPRSEIRGEPRGEIRGETRGEPREIRGEPREIRGEPRRESRVDVRDLRGESRIDGRVDPRGESRIDGRGDSRGEPRIEGRGDHRELRADLRGDARGDHRGDPRTDSRGDVRGDSRGEPRSFGNGYMHRSNHRQPEKSIRPEGHHSYDSVPAYHSSYDRYRDGGPEHSGHYKSGFEPESRGHVTDRYNGRRPEHQVDRGQPYYVEERRKSGYFDLPVDSRDYRHSFAEPQHRRLQLGAQY